MKDQITAREAVAEMPIAVSELANPEEEQLARLENDYLRQIGEPILTEEKRRALTEAIRAGRITFFIARRGAHAVGMCSVARCFSTFACSDVGVFEDFYVEPAFRGRGVARMLARVAQEWCRANGIASLTVCSAPCDAKMYQALGFGAPLGTTFAYLG